MGELANVWQTTDAFEFGRNSDLQLIPPTSTMEAHFGYRDMGDPLGVWLRLSLSV